MRNLKDILEENGYEKPQDEIPEVPQWENRHLPAPQSKWWALLKFGKEWFFKEGRFEEPPKVKSNDDSFWIYVGWILLFCMLTDGCQ